MKVLQEKLRQGLQQALAFRVLLFAILLLSLYVFITWRIDSLSNAKPNAAAVASQSTTAQPHIYQTIVDKIKQLQDNSVNVRALFNQARANPFQE